MGFTGIRLGFPSFVHPSTVLLYTPERVASQSPGQSTLALEGVWQVWSPFFYSSGTVCLYPEWYLLSYALWIFFLLQAWMTLFLCVLRILQCHCRQHAASLCKASLWKAEESIHGARFKMQDGTLLSMTLLCPKCNLYWMRCTHRKCTCARVCVCVSACACMWVCVHTRVTPHYSETSDSFGTMVRLCYLD